MQIFKSLTVNEFFTTVIALCLIIMASSLIFIGITTPMKLPPPVYIDRYNGCHYWQATMTPRLEPSGKQLCRMADMVPGTLIGAIKQ